MPTETDRVPSDVLMRLAWDAGHLAARSPEREPLIRDLFAMLLNAGIGVGCGCLMSEPDLCPACVEDEWTAYQALKRRVGE